MRAILYARVSTAEQVEKGYSLRQQVQRLRDWCAENGHEVVEAIEERGVSGTILERPGLGRALELVAGGDADLLLAQDMDRISREPWHFGYLKAKLDEHGASLRTLDDSGDDSAESEFFRDIRRGMAKMERGITARRTSRGRERRAREGKIVGAACPPLGFKFNSDRTMLVVDEEGARLVNRIFRLIVEEGYGLNTVKKRMERDGIPSPQGKKLWNCPILRDVIQGDVYKPHSRSELQMMVERGQLAADVFERTVRDAPPETLWGVWWYGRDKVIRTGKLTPSGKPARRFVQRPLEECVAVPVPDCGVPREWVERARAAIKDNRRPPSSGRRFWELSGGALRCGCGRFMVAHTNTGGGNPNRKSQFHYVCAHRRRNGADSCEHGRYHQAGRTEDRVREFVLRLLEDPETLREGVVEGLRRERDALGDAEGEAAHLNAELEGLKDERRGYLRQNARGVMSDVELDGMLADADGRAGSLEAELAALAERLRTARELDGYEAMLDDYLADLPDLLTMPVWKRNGPGPERRMPGEPLEPYLLTPENAKPRPERSLDRDAMGRKFREVYDALGLRVFAHHDRTLVIEWGIGERHELAPGEPADREIPQPTGLPMSSDSHK